MLSPEIYHTSIIVLLDISDQDSSEKHALQPTLEYLKKQRLNALKDEAINRRTKKTPSHNDK